MSLISTTNESENAKAETPATAPPLVFRRLTPELGGGVFSCGDADIDDWFETKALDQHKNYICRVVTAHLEDDTSPVGFFALAMKTEKERDLAGGSWTWSSSQSSHFPTVHLSSVAVQKDMQRQGIGTVLMGAALAEFYQIVIRTGIFAMTLVAVDQAVVRFYRKLGFVIYGDRNDPMPKMILPAAAVIEMIEGAGAVNLVL